MLLLPTELAKCGLATTPHLMSLLLLSVCTVFMTAFAALLGGTLS